MCYLCLTIWCHDIPHVVMISCDAIYVHNVFVLRSCWIKCAWCSYVLYIYTYLVCIKQYYKVDPQSKPQGSIHLASCIITPITDEHTLTSYNLPINMLSSGSQAHDCVFTIQDVQINRTFVIMCVASNERAVWMAALKQHGDEQTHQKADMRVEVEGMWYNPTTWIPALTACIPCHICSCHVVLIRAELMPVWMPTRMSMCLDMWCPYPSPSPW